MRYLIGSIASLCSVALAGCASERPALTEGFVHLRDAAPTIVQDMRYYGARNFVGRPINGYGAPECILAAPAAEALARVQADLQSQGLTLKVFDCYRPQRAVDDFIAWGANDDQQTKAEYYPNLEKDTLFDKGYIAERSGHSRGATVDLAIARIGDTQSVWSGTTIPCTEATGANAPIGQLDFGVAYDCFDTLSNTDDPRIKGAAADNRKMLVAAMRKHGFANYHMEWWHFTFRPEPFPDTYFNFEIR